MFLTSLVKNHMYKCYGSGGPGIDTNVKALFPSISLVKKKSFTFKTKQEQNQCGLVKNHRTRNEKIWD